MKANRLKRLCCIITMMIILFASCMLLGEGYLRWHYFALPTDNKHLPHPYLQSILRPGIKIKNDYLNKRGFRSTGKYHSGEDVYKILAIGDSCTFSISSSKQKMSYPTLLEKALVKKYNTEFEVYNAGVPGYNSMQMFLNTARTFKRIKPDEVFIYGGWNDFRVMVHDRGMLYIENNCLGMPKMYRHASYWELDKNFSNRFQRILSRSFLYNHLNFKIRAYFTKKRITNFWKNKSLNKLPGEPVFIEKIFANFENNIGNIIALSKGNGAGVSIITLGTPLKKIYIKAQEKVIREKFKNDFLRLTPSEMFYYVDRFNKILTKLAKEYHCNLYDWAEWYKQVDDMSMFVDTLHPSDKGYKYLVNNIVSRKKLSGF